MKSIIISDDLHYRLVVAKAKAHAHTIEDVILVRGDDVVC